MAWRMTSRSFNVVRGAMGTSRLSGGSPAPPSVGGAEGCKTPSAMDQGPRPTKRGVQAGNRKSCRGPEVGSVRREDPDPIASRLEAPVGRGTGAPEDGLRGSVLSRSPTAIGSLRVKRLLQRKARRESMREAGRREGEPPERPR